MQNLTIRVKKTRINQNRFEYSYSINPDLKLGYVLHDLPQIDDPDKIIINHIHDDLKLFEFLKRNTKRFHNIQIAYSKGMVHKDYIDFMNRKRTPEEDNNLATIIITY